MVSANQYGGVTTESAFAASENLLAAHKGPDGALGVQGIFCPNESTAFGMLRRAGGRRPRAGKVAFVGFDSCAQDDRRHGQRGHMDATVVQDPIKMGYPGRQGDGRPPGGAARRQTQIDTGATLITRATMGTPEAQALLNPDFKKWLKE